MEDNTVMNEIEEIQNENEAAAAPEESGNFGAFVVGMIGGAAAYLIIREAGRFVNFAACKWSEHKQKKAAATKVVDAEIVEEVPAESDEETQNN